MGLGLELGLGGGHVECNNNGHDDPFYGEEVMFDIVMFGSKSMKSVTLANHNMKSSLKKKEGRGKNRSKLQFWEQHHEIWGWRFSHNLMIVGTTTILGITQETWELLSHTPNQDLPKKCALFSK